MNLVLWNAFFFKLCETQRPSIDGLKMKVSLETIADRFFSSMQACRDFHFVLIAGADHSPQEAFDKLNVGHPVFFTRPTGMDYEVIKSQAKQRLFCGALADIRKINGAFYTEVRRFLELFRISKLNISENEKKTEFQKVLELRSENFFTIAQEIEALLADGVGFAKELKSLHQLEVFFSQALSPKPPREKILDDLEVHLLRADLSTDEKTAQRIMNVLPCKRSLPQGTHQDISHALLQEIFFTPYAVGVKMIESIQNQLNQQKAPQTH